MSDNPTRGDRFVTHVLHTYDLSASAEEIVLQIGRLVDKADLLEEATAVHGVTAESPQGPRVAPWVVEARQTALAIQRLASSIDLPLADL